MADQLWTIYYKPLSPYIIAFTVTAILSVYVSILKYEKDPFTIRIIGDTELSTHIACGEELIMYREMCLNSNIDDLFIQREIIHLASNTSIKLSTIRSNEQPNACHTVIYTVQIPQHLKPGDYYYQPTLIYSLNWLKTIVKESPGQYFTIDASLCKST